jgi:hypothetical protein
VCRSASGGVRAYVVYGAAMTPNPKRPVRPKASEVVDGVTIKYHAGGKTVWSKGRVKDGEPVGYWEWYRPDGTLKRSGHFDSGTPVGEWTTYDPKGAPYKVTKKGPIGAT